MQNPPPGAAGKSSTGLDENIAALLSYIFGWVSGLIFFLIEKGNRLVRFHAMQSILFNVFIIVVCIVLWVVTIIIFLIASQLPGFLSTLVGLISTLIWLGFSLAVLLAWIMCLVKSYQGQYYKLPIIGDMAEKITNK
ncbi:MAG: DUF4870 domain-containing protein [Pyrinomonadaceae bacterium]